MLSFTAVPWVISIALIAVAEFTMAPLLMMAATGAFVVLTIVMTVSTVSLWLVSFCKRGLPTPALFHHLSFFLRWYTVVVSGIGSGPLQTS